ncbi:MAG: tetratricopeptide repeat protein [Proteobacteria bacterium]|nr:tetratricopeptide repeat protein [Pseudomonadota bacterium]
MTKSFETSAADFNRAVDLIRRKQVAEGCRILLDQVQPSSEPTLGLVDVALLLWGSDLHDDAILVFYHAHEEDKSDLWVVFQLARALYSQQRFEELLPFAERLHQEQPEDSEWYGYMAWGHYAKGEPEKCREVIAKGLRHGKNGVNFQPGKRHSLEGPSRTRIMMARNNQADGLVNRLKALYEQPSGQTRPTTATVPKEVAAEIGGTEAVWKGTTGAVVAGTIGGTTLATEYYFAYGTDEKNLDRRTETRWVPPGRTNRILQQAVDALHEWQIYAVESEVVGDDPDPESPDAFAFRLISPFGKDRNHMNGTGIADLFLGWYGRWLISEDQTECNRANSLDLRDAEVELVLRPKGLDARDFLLAVNVQSNTGKQSNEKIRGVAPWALTGQLIDPETLDENNWNRLTFRFRDSPRAWSFCGDTPEEQTTAARYSYHPLGDVLSHHQGNICFWFILGDARDPPAGIIDLRSIGLRYRNWSILTPDAGAELTGFPEDSLSDPHCLTSGWLDNPKEMWFSARQPKTPQEFIWQLPNGAAPKAVKVHQNTLRPAKTIEILISADGDAFQPLGQVDLPAAKPITQVPPQVMIALEGKPASHLKLVIHSGHQDDFWGLDGIEVFDDGVPPVPELEPASVSEEIDDLEPGQKLFFQLVAENAAGESRGPVTALDIPATQKPAITDGRVLKQTGERTTLFLEIMPCGLDTEVRARIAGPSGETFEGPVLSAGRNLSVRHLVYAFDGSEAVGSYKAEITAQNEAGESDPFLLEWEKD